VRIAIQCNHALCRVVHLLHYSISLLVYSHTNCLFLFAHQHRQMQCNPKGNKKEKEKKTNLTTSRPHASPPSSLIHQSHSSVRAITAYRSLLSLAALLFSLSSGALPRPSPLLPPLPFGWLYRLALDWKRGSQRVLNPFKTPPFSALRLPLFPPPPPSRIKCGEICAVRGVVAHPGLWLSDLGAAACAGSRNSPAVPVR
jgi:hypothetical protein